MAKRREQGMMRDEQGQGFDRIKHALMAFARHDIERSPTRQISARNRSTGWLRRNAGIAMLALLTLMMMGASASAEESGRTWVVSGGGTPTTPSAKRSRKSRGAAAIGLMCV